LIRVLVVADSAIARASLAEVVANDARLDLAGIATLADAASRIAEVRPDVLLMQHARAPTNDGLQHVPSVTLADEPQAGLAAEASSHEIVAAVVAAAAGLAVRQPPSQVRPTLQALPSETLTRRERAVLERLALGAANREIAAQLHISEHTVKFHVASILAKLGASNRAEAISRGIRLGLLML